MQVPREQIISLSNRIQSGRPTFSLGIRKRLSGPALRTFIASADLWRLSHKQCRHLLGSPPLATYRSWLRKARGDKPFTLTAAILTRISVVLQIHRSLAVLFATDREVLEWLRGPHQAPPFGGRSPLDLMLGGKLDDLMAVQRFVRSAREGLYMLPNAIDENFAPYSNDEIIIEDAAARDTPARAATATSAAAEREAPDRLYNGQ